MKILFSFLDCHLTEQFGFLQIWPTAGLLPGWLIIIDKEASFLGKDDANCGPKSIFAFGLVFIHLYIKSFTVCQTQGQLKSKESNSTKKCNEFCESDSLIMDELFSYNRLCFLFSITYG